MIKTKQPIEMPRHPADHTTAGRQRWESKATDRWQRTFGRWRRGENGKTKYRVVDGNVVKTSNAL